MEIYLLLIHLSFVGFTSLVCLDAFRYRGGYAPGAGALHSQLIFVGLAGAFLSWIGFIAIYFLEKF